MITFLSPLFLAGAAAAALPIVLHLLKRQPEPRVKFAVVSLLKDAPVEHVQKRHVRELLLLALRVAALLLLALAFARPFFASGGAASAGEVTVVALDTSYSMGAPGRFERAQQLAKDAIGRARAGELIGVITFSDVADVAAPVSADRAAALSAIEQAAPEFGATRYRAGLGLAAQALAGRSGAIVVVSDLQESGWDAGDRATVPDSTRVEVADVGPMPADLAVVAVRVQGDRLIASVRNSGTRPRETKARLTLDGRPSGETTISVPANGSADAVFAVRPGAATASVEVDDRDGLQADNTRYAIVSGAERPGVLAVTSTGDLEREAFYLDKALSAGGAGDAFRVTAASGAGLSAWDEPRLRAFSAVALLSTSGLERRGREALAAYAHAGGGILIAAGPNLDGDVAADVLGRDVALQIAAPGDARPEPRALAPADVRHPVFEAFGDRRSALNLVTFHQVSRVAAKGCQPVARFTTGEAAMLDCAIGDGRAVIVASDLNNRWNDFPLHASYVPFLNETMRYLAGGRPRMSDYVIGDGPKSLPRTPGIATIADLSVPGGSRRVAVNVDPRELEPARMTPQAFTSAVARLKDASAAEARNGERRQEERQHLWQYAIVLVIAVLAAEGIVAARTA